MKAKPRDKTEGSTTSPLAAKGIVIPFVTTEKLGSNKMPERSSADMDDEAKNKSVDAFALLDGSNYNV
jgi:hypothetical protein